MTVFHHHMTSLVFYEIANDGVHSLPKHLTIRENTIDRLSDLAQTLSPLFVLGRKISDVCGRGGIANLQPGKNQVFLRMMVHLRVNFKIAYNRANNLVIRPISPVENLQLALEDDEQPLNVAMFPG
jgi:hypothetical protein